VSDAGEDAITRAEALQARLDELRARLESSEDPQQAVDAITELAQIAKEIEIELERARKAADEGA
jgi:hypothetical protein